MKAKIINIKNKKAYFKYEIIDNYVAGVQLLGTEIKSIRNGDVSFTDAYCYFNKNELFLKSFHITEYEQGSYGSHEPKRERKLLLTKKELKKLSDKIKEGGLTIVPLRLFINDRGLAKFDIGLAKGKKLFDKRKTILEREEKIKIKRDYKINI